MIMATFNSSLFWNNARKVRQTVAEMTSYISRNTSGSVIFNSYNGTLPGGGIHRVNENASYRYIAGTDFADKISNGNGTKGYGDARGCTIVTGAGNDSIENYADSVNVYAGTGNDTISLGLSTEYNEILYHSGDGNDLIKNFTNDTWDKHNKLIIGSGKYWTQEHGKDVIVHVGSGKITLEGARVRAGGLAIEGTYDYSAATIPSGTYIRNTDAPTVVKGTAYDDLIINEGNAEPATMRGIYGNVITYGQGGSVTINADAGEDFIYTYPWTASTITAGRGNDTISVAGKNLIKYANGDGNDLITGFASTDTLSITSGTYSTQTSGSNILVKVGNGTITIQGGKGKTINIKGSKASPTPTISGVKNISNGKSYTAVSGTSYNDTITNTGSYVTVYAYAGNDKISNKNGNNHALIYAGDGNDSVYGHNNYVTVYAGAGADTITGNHYTSKLYGDSGNDFINITTYWKNTIDGGSGNDTIIAGGGNHSVNGGAGNDKISLSGDNLTVRGDTGNDNITSSGKNNLFIYSKGDGNDSVVGFNEKSTLRVDTGSNVSLQTSGKNVIATVGKGKATLTGAATLNSINIQGSSSSDSVRNSVNKANINALGGNDTIINYGLKVTINSGAGNDHLVNWSGVASMVGGAGNDTISGDAGADTLRGGADNDNLYGYAGNDRLYGDAGNDYLRGNAGNDSLWGGAGNDTLYGDTGKDVFIYKPGEGTDRIKDYSYSEGDMLQILKTDGKAGGTFTKAGFSGNNLVLTISGGGSVIMEGISKGNKINVNGITYKLK